MPYAAKHCVAVRSRAVWDSRDDNSKAAKIRIDVLAESHSFQNVNDSAAAPSFMKELE